MSDGGRDSPVVLDACCLINLAATGKLEGVIRELPWPAVVTTVVLAEALHVYGPMPAEPGVPRSREPLDVRGLVVRGVVTEMSLQTDAEYAAFVRYAADVDDGEAAGLALAKLHGLTLATDDRKARRIAAAGGIRLLGTPELVRAWAEAVGLKADAIGPILERVRDRARFVPAQNLPESDWWMSHLRGEV